MRGARTEMYHMFMSDKGSEVTRDWTGMDPYLYAHYMGEAYKKGAIWGKSHVSSLSYHMKLILTFTLYREIVLIVSILKLT